MSPETTSELAMFSTAAFFTSFIEPFLFKRKVIFYEVILGFVVVGGVFLIFNAEFQFMLGIILGLSSAFFASLFSVLNGLMIKKNSAIIKGVNELKEVKQTKNFKFLVYV